MKDSATPIMLQAGFGTDRDLPDLVLRAKSGRKSGVIGLLFASMTSSVGRHLVDGAEHALTHDLDY
jgi:hypothetical protein